MGDVPAMPRWVDVVTAVLLSVAGLASAFASFQAALWGGEQVSKYSTAGARMTSASQFDIVAGQTAAIDTAVFVAWVDAAHGGEADRAEFLEQRFSPPFAAAFASWRPLLPDDLTGYRLPQSAPRVSIPRPVYPQSGEAAKLRAEAAGLFAAGETANRNSDRFVAVTVLLSTVLFLGGISQLMKRPGPRIMMLLLAGLLCLGALGWLATLPASRL